MKTATSTYPTLSNKRVFYLKFLRENADTIENVRIISPKLGKKGLGAIEVETKYLYGNV